MAVYSRCPAIAAQIIKLMWPSTAEVIYFIKLHETLKLIMEINQPLTSKLIVRERAI